LLPARRNMCYPSKTLVYTDECVESPSTCCQRAGIHRQDESLHPASLPHTAFPDTRLPKPRARHSQSPCRFMDVGGLDPGTASSCGDGDGLMHRLILLAVRPLASSSKHAYLSPWAHLLPSGVKDSESPAILFSCSSVIEPCIHDARFFPLRFCRIQPTWIVHTIHPDGSR
jgi:hypothetical protein